MEINKAKQPKRIDFSKGYFEANGKKYYVQSVLTIERFCEFQILEKELAFSMSFQNVFDQINSACESLNKSKLLDASVTLDDLRRGVARLERKEPTALKLCTLFINTEDEDPTIWNNDIMTKKLNDWKTEGIAIDDFFQYAMNSVNGYVDIYKKMSEAISDKKK